MSLSAEEDGPRNKPCMSISLSHLSKHPYLLSAAPRMLFVCCTDSWLWARNISATTRFATAPEERAQSICTNTSRDWTFLSFAVPSSRTLRFHLLDVPVLKEGTTEAHSPSFVCWDVHGEHATTTMNLKNELAQSESLSRTFVTLRNESARRIRNRGKMFSRCHGCDELSSIEPLRLLRDLLAQKGNSRKIQGRHYLGHEASRVRQPRSIAAPLCLLYRSLRHAHCCCCRLPLHNPSISHRIHMLHMTS